MKLSYERGRGGTLIEPSRLCRVTRTHVVTPNIDQHGEGMREDLDEHSRAVASPGDLVLELCRARDKEPIAHSYLTGEAVQCMSHETAPAWLEDAGPVWWIELPTPKTHPTPEKLSVALALAILSARYGLDGDDPFERARVAAFALRVPKGEFDAAVEAIWDVLHYQPVTAPDGGELRRDIPCVTHLCGVIRGSRRRGPLSVMHVQPPGEAQDYGAAPFAIEGLVRLARAAGVKAPCAGSLERVGPGCDSQGEAR